MDETGTLLPTRDYFVSLASKKRVTPTGIFDVMIDEKILVEAIRGKRKVRLRFHSKEDGSSLVRTCAPMDVGPSRRTKDKSVRFHFWDFDSDTVSHTLSILPTQVLSIEVTGEAFDPASFVSWDTKKSPWFIERDWGPHS